MNRETEYHSNQMAFLVIHKKSVNKIYTIDNDQEPEIDMLEFQTKEEAEYYLQHGTIQKITNQNEHIRVFTDGSCSMNGAKDAKAGIGVYFGEGDQRNVSRRIHGKQSNNTAEMLAIIEVFKILKKEIIEGKKIIIYSDSKYSINTFTEWAPEWEKNNWIKKSKGEIKNIDIVKQGYQLFKESKNVTIKHVKGHSNKKDELSKGNEEADRLANMSIRN